MHARTCLAVLIALASSALVAAPAHADEYLVDELPGGYVLPGAATVSTLIGNGQDDRTVDVTLPFSFAYFGRLHDRVSVCSNGWLAMGQTTSTNSVNAALPSSDAPDGVIAPLWDDLTTGTGSVRSFVLGEVGSRVFVVDWNGVSSFDSQATGLSFQAQLYEGSGEVFLAYAAGGTYAGLSYTAGIEDPTGSIAFAAGGAGNDLSGRPSGDGRFTPPPIVFHGTLLRDRPTVDAGGLGAGELTRIPVSGATVRVVREDTGETAALGNSAADGSFAVTVFGVDAPLTFAVEVLAAGPAGRVVGATGTTYALSVASGLPAELATPLGEVSIDAAVDAVHPTFRRALNVHQVLERGRATALAAAAWAATNVAPQTAPDTVSTLEVRWVAGAAITGGTSYTPAGELSAARLVVNDGTANPDPWDDDVLLRTYGQHVLAALSAHPGTLSSPRGFAVATSEEFAWADGFGAWFAAIVKGDHELIDTLSTDAALVDDLETPPSGARGVTFPAAVAGSLWDLVDAANEPEDEFEGTTGAAPSTAVDVLATVDRALDALAQDATGFTARSFFDKWRATGETADRVRTARIFIHHGTLPDDAAEPDDTAAEATLAPGVGLVFAGRTLSPFNDDRVRIDVPGPNPLSLRIGLAQTTTTGLDVELLDDSEVSIAFASTVAASDPATLRLDVFAPLQPGTYTVRVGWRSGEAATYSLSLYSPLLVTRASVPEWTVGVPFKEDMSVAGGVPPYSVSTTTTAPGLTIVNDVRVTGTPTDAGAFDVAVSVLDAAAPQNAAGLTIPLRINAALGLRPLLALPAGRTVDVAIGTGGTAPVWAELSPEPVPLGLVGGATLRLTGPSGTARSFNVSGSATDAVGAVFPAATADVVVTSDLHASDGSAVPADDFVGYFLDALAGSRLDATLRFRGVGRTPAPAAILDETGAQLALDPNAFTSFGRKVRLRGVTAPHTGRFHIVFTRDDFVGTVSTHVRVRPPRVTGGQAGIASSAETAEFAFHALAGSRVRIIAQRAPAPADLRPTVVAIEDPDGALLALPTERRSRRGRRAQLVLTVPADGRYVARIGALPGTSGPLQVRIVIDRPRRGRLVLD